MAVVRDQRASNVGIVVVVVDGCTAAFRKVHPVLSHALEAAWHDSQCRRLNQVQLAGDATSRPRRVGFCVCAVVVSPYLWVPIVGESVRTVRWTVEIWPWPPMGSNKLCERPTPNPWARLPEQSSNGPDQQIAGC
ncbi:hypothetical protein B0T17DRAFT_510437 [Bombardia bombarda]|uniref:Uncharacterized protein n=1 Tax=Bombardia bombarda TaxID=252184 RepID=A0AA39WI76_9PEZI|nr:hypothetical protein B0T17DRAFT_510437 [Bombardia bombarda]